MMRQSVCGLLFFIFLLPLISCGVGDGPSLLSQGSTVSLSISKSAMNSNANQISNTALRTGDQAVFTVNANSNFVITGQTVGGNCPKGIWTNLTLSAGTYTTGPLTSDCNVTFLAEAPHINLGVVTTIAGSTPSSGFYQGGLAIASNGDLFSGVNGDGVMQFVAPSFSSSTLNNTDFLDVRGVALDSFGNIWATATSDGKLFKVSPTGVATEILTGLLYPTGVAIDQFDTVYFLNSGTNEILKVNGTTTISIATVSPDSFGIAIDFSGNIYVTSSTSNTLMRLSPPLYSPVLLAGSGTAATVDGTGSLASFNTPQGIAVDRWGTLYVAEGAAFGSGGNTIRKITQAGVVTTLAGDGTAATTDGSTTTAEFNGPMAVTISASGTLFVQEIGIAGGNILRRVD